METLTSLKWEELASQTSLDKAIDALRENNIETILAKDAHDAKKILLNIIPQGSQVMDMNSQTLKMLGIPEEINKSGKYVSVKKKLASLHVNTQKSERNKIGAAPEWAIGSVHAITEDGRVMIASNTGSQLPAYAYAALNVVWIAGTQKIVKNIDEGFKRIYEYCLPLEDAHVRQITDNKEGSEVSKILILNKEKQKKRIHLILVPQILGY